MPTCVYVWAMLEWQLAHCLSSRYPEAADAAAKRAARTRDMDVCHDNSPHAAAKHRVREHPPWAGRREHPRRRRVLHPEARFYARLHLGRAAHLRRREPRREADVSAE